MFLGVDSVSLGPSICNEGRSLNDCAQLIDLMLLAGSLQDLPRSVRLRLPPAKNASKVLECLHAYVTLSVLWQNMRVRAMRVF